MSYLINNQQKIDEIIFAKRNKSYGAYVIRSSYGSTVAKSLTIVLFGFGAFMATAFYLSNRNNIDPNKEEMSQILPIDSFRVVEYKQKEDLEQPKEQKHEEKQEQKKSDPQESTDLSKVKVVDSVRVERNIDVTKVASVGTPSGTTEGPSTPSTTTGGGGITTPTNTNTIHVFVDKNPEFEGGLKALYAFVGSKLRYPTDAFDIGKEGTVYVKFVVDEKGKVGNLSLLNNVGYGLDQEALRVVGLIPDFISPGMIDGKPVKVYYQLPIKFRMK